MAAGIGTASADPTKYPPPNNNCQNTGSFERWLAGFRQEAVAAGISRATIQAALDGMTLDHGIIARDRKQGFFAQSFTAFAGKLVTPNRIQAGAAKLKQHRELLARVEKDYGVPGPVIVAFWALESDFGAGMGNLPVLRSLVTLAYDCRRPQMFRDELMDALRIIDRGDLTPGEMIGSWAGELGQTQFLPSHYFKHAVDYDGDGRRNLMRSTPDVVASTANFLVYLGWQRGQPWLDEVRVPSNLAWDQADLAIQHPRAKWAAWGVTLADGRPLPGDNLPASLVLPMGRFGPAFLAYPNFQAYLKWNQSLNYCLSAAHLAARLAGAPPFRKGSAEIPEWSQPAMKELQQLLVRRGYQVGEVDGKMGAGTRAAVKSAQMKFGLPADSYPTPELLERLRR
ncbi:MAG TPA: lytic murein transglycosylase [Hyphomicrobiaceae bacterium]|nr:lytic murein transglycosylase [Hyphomicrobiaceae bacterium]